MGARVGTVMVIAACHGGAPGPSDAAIARCGALTASPVMPDCAGGPTSCVLPPNQGVVDGTRLHARWWRGAAGDRIFQAIHDTVLDADCIPDGDPDQVRPCIPRPGIHLYADNACMTPVLDSPVRHYLRTGTGVEILDPGPARASTFFSYRDPTTGLNHCVASDPPTSGFDAKVVGTIRIDRLASIHPATQPGSMALDLVVDGGDDGSSFTAISADPTRIDALAIDRARAAPCTWIYDRCLPVPAGVMGCNTLGCAFEGPTCETCDGTQQGSGSGTRFGVIACPTSPLSASDLRVSLVATTQECAGGVCACSSEGPVVDFVPPGAFPALRIVNADGARLHVAALTDGDGYCRPLLAYLSDVLSGAAYGHAFDATLGIFCYPAMTAQGRRCVPDIASLANVQSNLFQDAACTQPITIATNDVFTVDARFARDRTIDAYYALGAPGSGGLYQLAGSTCLPFTTRDMTWWSLGPRAEASFEALSDQID